MAKPYTINIADGTATSNVATGTYTVTSEITGYDNASIDPAEVNVTEDVTSYAFKVSATGTLTLHVTEDGTDSGTAIVGATFSRCDSSGNEYGDPVVTDDSGNAVFEHVPYAESDAPLIYYKQITSDGDHDFSSELANTSLTEETLTVEIANGMPPESTFTLTDANYEDLPIESGTITFE